MYDSSSSHSSSDDGAGSPPMPPRGAFYKSESGTATRGFDCEPSRFEQLLKVQGEVKKLDTHAATSWKSAVRAVFPLWMICAVLAGVASIAVLEVQADPHFVYKGSEVPKWRAYLTMIGCILSVTMLVQGVREHFVYVGFLTVLTASGVISYDVAIGGFATASPWVPLLQAVICKGIQESGLLADVLVALLGKAPKGSVRAGVRLYCVSVFLGAIIGVGPTVTYTTPVIVRWARVYGIRMRPLLYMLVVGSTCGSAMLLTSAPSSLAIQHVLCQEDTLECREPGMFRVAPLALINACILGVYAGVAGRWLAEWAGDAQRANQAAEINRTESHRRPGWVTEDLDAEMPPRYQSSPEVCPQPEEANVVMPRLTVQRPRAHLPYDLDFIVMADSALCDHTPQTSGLALDSRVHLREIYRCCSSSPFSEAGDLELSPEMVRQQSLGTDDPGHMSEWRFQPGDVIRAQCSAAGLAYMRTYRGLYVLHALPSHKLLGGRRHQRRLFEAVVAVGSPLIGHTLNELLGFEKLTSDFNAATLEINNNSAPKMPRFMQLFRGYPVASWRRVAETNACRDRPLSLSQDVVAAGDVMLLDAFQELPTLPHTASHFLVTSMVPNSQAPRHGRLLDKCKGMLAICGLFCAVAFADTGTVPILLGFMILVVLLVLTKTVQADQAIDVLKWPSFLSIGAGIGVAHALLTSGVAEWAGSYFEQMNVFGGIRLELCALAVIAQTCSYRLSNEAAGIMMATLALVVANKNSQLQPNDLSVLVIVSVNMKLSADAAEEAAKKEFRKRRLSFKEMLCWGLPARAIVAVTVVFWTVHMYVH